MGRRGAAAGPAGIRPGVGRHRSPDRGCHGTARCPGPDGVGPQLLFCENETNLARLYGADPVTPYPKDGINDHVVHGASTVNLEADEFYAELTPAGASADEALVLRQACAGMLWSKQLFGNQDRDRAPAVVAVLHIRRFTIVGRCGQVWNRTCPCSLAWVYNRAGLVHDNRTDYGQSGFG